MYWKKISGIILVIAICICGLGVILVSAKDNSGVIKENKLPEKAFDLIRTKELLSHGDDRREAEMILIQHASLKKDDKAMANFNGTSEVYAEPDQNSTVVGIIYLNTRVTVNSRTSDWANITTGNLNGYIPCDKLLFGASGDILMNAKCPRLATAQIECMGFTEADENSQVSKKCDPGDQFFVVGIEHTFYKVSDGENVFFIQKDDVAVEVQLKDGQTIAEIEQENQSTAISASAGNIPEASGNDYSNSGNYARYLGISMTEEEKVLFANVLFLEAGDNYEEALKVSNVIFNRVLDTRYGNTVMEVLSQTNQFVTFNDALSGEFGTTQNCIDAMEAACRGENSAGMAVNFKATGDGITNYYYGTAIFETN